MPFDFALFKKFREPTAMQADQRYSEIYALLELIRSRVINTTANTYDPNSDIIKFCSMLANALQINKGNLDTNDVNFLKALVVYFIYAIKKNKEH